MIIILSDTCTIHIHWTQNKKQKKFKRIHTQRSRKLFAVRVNKHLSEWPEWTSEWEIEKMLANAFESVQLTELEAKTHTQYSNCFYINSRKHTDIVQIKLTENDWIEEKKHTSFLITHNFLMRNMRQNCVK